ncbi:VanY-A/VanY-F/VanY-M family D-Ala-D-Ala carboxypeptidase [Bacillus sp. ISL-47]|uniref:VanY-A/VanY-F/VanY-M family D-Ala-D-Ala carboxypeptidase n=1 Tax=Bacillus sp. ISL-47 TaxID=2819130 RepID=UPI001BEB1227|nr:VanY-A/VanY-F/VanY-M family D-Ala-D-Ala carboxypeptidase [Bacillus sp. ISL-47]MBT2686777.1 VanY-A/VanY-F/VanY-M family D-Ala-D-Ala carboxypeptidase [Bacillus sp. ISL-47]MBT2706871.1 VanY-A/VanY-F/VanY-M family D-Ala-D-Ala carboxypeptidase [Pseudomonas sp. ISL-84]
MKKWGFLLLVCLGLTFINMEPFFEPKVKIQNDDQQENDIVDRRTSEYIQKEIAEEQIYQGNLLLVNSEHPVHPESIKSDVINLSERNEWTRGYGLLNSGIYLSEDVAREFSEMIATAEKEGVRNFSITSGFRGFEEQSVLYQEMGSDYALPAGYSEHNLGLSLDVGSAQMKMADAPEGKWIEENAWKYGFILRYPKDKTDVTGIQYEPWHIRYVGLPHSAIMKEKNFALEEYLDYLKEEKQISVSINGEEYTITYYPIPQTRTINVPDNSYFEISGNNIDGVFVTVYE